LEGQQAPIQRPEVCDHLKRIWSDLESHTEEEPGDHLAQLIEMIKPVAKSYRDLLDLDRNSNVSSGFNMDSEEVERRRTRRRKNVRNKISCSSFWDKYVRPTGVSSKMVKGNTDSKLIKKLQHNGEIYEDPIAIKEKVYQRTDRSFVGTDIGTEKV